MKGLERRLIEVAVARVPLRHAPLTRRICSFRAILRISSGLMSLLGVVLALKE
jgi:hypothetical protein